MTFFFSTLRIPAFTPSPTNPVFFGMGVVMQASRVAIVKPQAVVLYHNIAISMLWCQVGKNLDG
jgi:hypothetical protein